MEPRVLIIILNWNGYIYTKDCLGSLRNLNYPNFQVIVVDNGSTDGSVEKLKAEFPDILLIGNKENLGFTGGNNAGMREALKSDPSYIMLLNNDTVVDRDMLSELVRVIGSDPKIGMVGPKIYYYDRKDVVWSAGTWHDRLLHRFKLIGRGQKDRGQFSKQRDVDELTACAMLIRREVIEKIGYLNDDYFRTSEDSEYCIRAKRAGYRLVFVPTSVIWHKVSSTTGGEESAQNVFYSTRNTLYLVKKFYSVPCP